MKALTLQQPWATLVAIGAKRVETRSWSTNYRGPLAIHAAATIAMGDFVLWKLCMSEPFLAALKAAGITDLTDLPRGVILATASLSHVQKIYIANRPNLPELAFGDYTSGRFAWYLDKVATLPEPVPARGALGLWEWKP